MSNALFYPGIVLEKTPAWAYLVLVLLCILGIRRLTSRPTSISGLAIVPTVFLVWSVIGAYVFGRASGTLTAFSLWLACSMAGLLSFRLVGPPKGRWINSQQFVRDGSSGPLIVYLGIFFFRYGLEIWAGFIPEQAQMAHGLAVTVSGFMAGRTLGDLWLAVTLRRAVATVR